MELFEPDSGMLPNILPYDGEASYHRNLFSGARANQLFSGLLKTIAWKHDELTVYGKKIVTKREVAWHGDRPYQYTYSKNTKTALPWTAELLEIKTAIESLLGDSFNSCLLNLYHDGTEGMSWHSDDEKELLDEGTIASVSFGAARKFQFRHKTSKETRSLMLENGSLLAMKGVTQKYWSHRLATTTKVLEPRVNLTFRTIVEG